MLKMLHIKCPSCGIVLEVNNSKDEAVKQIVCPNCKKRLSVDFREKPVLTTTQPAACCLYYGQMRIDLKDGVNNIPLPGSENVEINVVRLIDGTSKCVVRPLSPNTPILYNGTVLSAEDKVVMTTGDELTVGNSVLGYGKPVQTTITFGNNVDETKTKVADPPKPRRSLAWSKLFLPFITTLLVAFVVFLLWPSKPSHRADLDDEDEEKVEMENRDTTQVSQPRPDQGRQGTVVVRQDVAPPVPPQPEVTSDYELEQLALQGDANAQYELGKRWINKHDSINTVKGIKYLKLAIQNGSDEAQHALQTVYDRLIREAESGNSVAEHILQEQR